jgi:phytol kinase
MWLTPFFDNAWTQDTVAAILTLGISLAWLRSMDAVANRGLISQRLSRKIIHIGTGPIFVLAWNFFSDAPQARWLAALVPLAITAQFVMVGLGVMKDEAAVSAMTRTGDRREILRGPLYYGIVFVVITIVFWLRSPVGILALMIMCGGDGLADAVGRRWGHAKLPWSPEKSWIGSAAMLAGSYVFGLVYIVLFNAMGHFEPVLTPGSTATAVLGITVFATAVESLPLRDVDNITITLSAIVGAWILIGPLAIWEVSFLP